MSYASFIVGDLKGKKIAELQPEIKSISWRLNSYGKVKFSLAVTDPKVTETNLKFGNMIAVEFENGLPTWGGIIDPPRTWEKGRVEITAYSAEYLFGFRITDKGRYFSGQTAGVIYQALIQEANVDYPTNIEIGQIYEGGDGHSPEYHFKDLFTIFTKSVTEKMSNFEFDVTAAVEGSYIKLYANFYSKKGSNKSYYYPLIDGKNLSEFKLQEQGPIINSWDLAGEGTNWGAERLTANAEDKDSISKYGLRQDSKIYTDVSQQSTLNQHALTLLEKNKDPNNLFTVGVADKEPAKFADYGIGDILRLIAPSYGFDGIDTNIRVLAREYFPADGVCVLVVEEAF